MSARDLANGGMKDHYTTHARRRRECGVIAAEPVR
jgi:hypothetical protein